MSFRLKLDGGRLAKLKSKREPKLKLKSKREPLTLTKALEKSEVSKWAAQRFGSKKIDPEIEAEAEAAEEAEEETESDGDSPTPYQRRLARILELREDWEEHPFSDWYDLDTDWTPGEPLPDGDFGKLERVLLASAEWAALSRLAKAMYTFFRGKYKGPARANAYSATMSELKFHGWTRAETRREAIKELIDARFIKLVRKATQHLPALYEIRGLPGRGLKRNSA